MEKFKAIQVRIRNESEVYPTQADINFSILILRAGFTLLFKLNLQRNNIIFIKPRRRKRFLKIKTTF